MVSTVSATKTIYLKPNANWLKDGARFALYSVEDGDVNPTWTDMLAVDGNEGYYSATIGDSFTKIVLCRMNGATTANNWDNKWTQTADITGFANNNLFTINDGDDNWTAFTKTSLPSISSVKFSYGKSGQSPWDNLVLTDNGNFTYSATVDLTSDIDIRNFKVVVNDTWLGTDQISLADDAETESLVTKGAKTGDNFSLDIRTYKKYTLTATWAISASATMGWTLAVTGSETRGSQTYNLTLNNDAGWEAVKVYTFNPNQSGAWAEADDMTNTSGSTWTYSKTFYEPYPQGVIFKDAGSKQTANLKLINNHTYTNKAVDNKYYVVGNISAFGNFDPAETTALMTATKDGENHDIHTYTIENLALSGNVEYKIIKKQYAEQTNPEWYPSDNKVITISEDGKYTLTIQFNDYWDDKSLATVTSYNADLTAVHATIGGAGCATFSSSTHDLDFTDVTGLTAYTATSAGGGFVHMESVSGKVPANTGLFLNGASDYIPVTTDAGAVGTNLLRPTTGSNIYDSKLHQYVLANQSGLGFYKVKSSLSPDAGKAYLETTEAIGSAAPSARVAIIFDDETTGIETVKASQKMNGEFFNLAGQRVAQPTKGLYIVNGKKVIMK